MFGLVLLSPPLGPEGLDEKIQELEKKKVEFTKEGQKLQKEENAELYEMIEQEVDDELAQERRADEGYDDEDDYYDEDEKLSEEGAENKKDSSNGAGESRVKTQKSLETEQKAAEQKKKKSKFNRDSDEDSDNYVGKSDPYSKPSRGGGRQVNQGGSKDQKQPPKQKMNLDNDDDFPTL